MKENALMKFLLFIFITSIVKSAYSDQVINLDELPEIQRVDINNYFGANVLYWIDDDNRLHDVNYIQTLKSLHMSALRFPGGEVADNYDWETNSLINPDAFPKESNTTDKKTRTDYLEFLNFAKKLNVKDIYFVVNIESAPDSSRNDTIEEKLEKQASHAAKWVKAVKQAGFFVPYWEIGNESYLQNTFSAKQYAAILKTFSAKMKQADPRIKIGAIGPNTSVGIASVSYVDKMSNEKTKDNWWTTIKQECDNCFDFISTHIYKRPSEFGENQLSLLRGDINQIFGKDIPISITEWNTSLGAGNRPYDDLDQGLNLSLLINDGLKSKLNNMLFWPVRINGRAGKTGLMDINTEGHKISYNIISEYLHNTKSIVLENREKNTLITTNDFKSYSIISTNYSNSPLVIKIKNKSSQQPSCRPLSNLSFNVKGKKISYCSFKMGNIELYVQPNSLSSFELSYSKSK